MTEPTVELNSDNPRTLSRGRRLAGGLLTALLVTLAYFVVRQPQLSMWRGMLTHGSPTQPLVALTFDDGPDPLWAPLEADTLERHGARGTFFLVGVMADTHPEIVARLVRAGHQIGCHSMTHPYPNLASQPESRVRWEVYASTALLTKLTGQPIRDFRPPGGGIDDTVLRLLRAHHLRLAWWSANIADADPTPPEVIVARLHMVLRPGLVALLHERETTVAGLERFFQETPDGRYTYTTFDKVIQ